MYIHQILIHRFNVKISLVVSFQIKVSALSLSWTSINRRQRCDQASHLSPIKVLLKLIFKGGAPWNTSCTTTFLFCAMLYNDGYCWLSGVSPNHVSSQNLVLLPSPILKEPLLKNYSFTLISPFQKGESVGLTST